jgi:mono/diheme cytochrome c family protein
MRKVLKWIGIVLGGLLGLLAVAVVGLLIYGQVKFKPRLSNRPLYAISADMSAEGVARGQYLLENVMGCAGACHSPGEDTPYIGTMEKIELGPAVFDFNAPNLTPDVETGLGAWSDAEIARAIREGVDRDGRALAIMPSFNYHVISDADIAAIIGYIRSLPPTRSKIEPFDANAFGKMILALNVIMPSPLGEPITTAQFTPDPASPDYGAYLVSIAACRDCHKPDLSGGPMVESGMIAPDLTGSGEFAHWSQADFITAMRTGARPDGRNLNPAMPYQEYGKMRDEDLAAVFQFLHALPPATASAR